MNDGSYRLCILNDGDTFTDLDGCQIAYIPCPAGFAWSELDGARTLPTDKGIRYISLRDIVDAFERTVRASDFLSTKPIND